MIPQRTYPVDKVAAMTGIGRNTLYNRLKTDIGWLLADRRASAEAKAAGYVVNHTYTIKATGQPAIKPLITQTGLDHLRTLFNAEKKAKPDNRREYKAANGPDIIEQLRRAHVANIKSPVKLTLEWDN